MKVKLSEKTIEALRVFMKIAFAVWIGMVAYVLVLPFHFYSGFPARAVHEFGKAAAIIAFFIAIALIAKKEGWIDWIEKLIGLQT